MVKKCKLTGNRAYNGNLNPFRYRGYYMDTETGMYYLMSRYYDPVTHMFLNADGYFQTGTGILDANMNAYCGNNPVNCFDPNGTDCICLHQRVRGDHVCNNSNAVMRTKEKVQRKDKKKGSENRQPLGLRERNQGHINGEEHSRKAKGTKIKRNEQITLPSDTAVPISEYFANNQLRQDILYDLPLFKNENTFENMYKYVINTGDKPIYEKIWDDITRIFN
ncbi:MULTISPECIES: RHS repeat-associated core domain-containing protein [unclassified Ruminococcus]|uniref:RHS repeat-associated core domain-containing protein n=1 Tax=unclassified Ruminococcus TaxID=2608920 RepID=UPI00210C4202|nr:MULTISPECIES: RHS repeat-associated core domain-containing protein [unclassified Ruminococcus]MCQ4021693.1 hypothetical protein [Ruminococcus sp. zg-924]MCQ4114138.1 hypothetical protein [Ruminococcus sp. zg-921]